jgi:soluble lytic murein transglycosylase-like protein
MRLFIYSLLIAASPLFSFPPALDQQIRDAARRSSLDPFLVKAVVSVESNFKSKATSHKGAMGLMQVMPKTAEEKGIQQPYHATNNLMGACDYLRELINRYRGNLEWALAAYNAGPRNVDKYKGIPPFSETQAYVRKVMRLYRGFKSSPSSQP